MKELLINTFDMACMIDSLDLGARDSASFKKAVWENEKAYLALTSQEDYKKWLYDIQYWADYLYDKPSLDAEFPIIQKDIQAQGNELNEEDYLKDNFDMDLFFKSMRLRILYLNKRGYERMKLRTLLSAYGYKRRSPSIIRYIKDCLLFYHIQTCLRGNAVCDIEEISLDDMITFRVLEKSWKDTIIMFEGYNITQIRFLPMNNENDDYGFTSEKSVREFFSKELVKDGKYYYGAKGLNIYDQDALILFQYNANIIAYGVLMTRNYDDGYYQFYKESIHNVEKISSAEFKAVNPDFKRFGNYMGDVNIELLEPISTLLKNKQEVFENKQKNFRLSEAYI